MCMNTHSHKHPDTNLTEVGEISRFHIHSNPSSDHNILWDSWGYRRCFNAVILQLFCITISKCQWLITFFLAQRPAPLLGLSEIGCFKIGLDIGVKWVQICSLGLPILGPQVPVAFFSHGGVQESKNRHSYFCSHSLSNTRVGDYTPPMGNPTREREEKWDCQQIILSTSEIMIC